VPEKMTDSKCRNDSKKSF